MDQRPLPIRIAVVDVARCVVRSAALIGRGAIRQPPEAVGRRVTFADGTSARIYREAVIDHAPADPCALVVEFRLRGVRGWGHPVFRAESLLNTPLLVGFPGFVSKWWLAHDENGVYRGLNDWDRPERAASYARALRWVLIESTNEDDRWWRPVAVT